MMRSLVALLGGCLFLLNAGCAGSSRGGGEDQKRIQGNWRVELAELGGKTSDDTELLSSTIRFEENKIVITVGDTTHEGTFTMDAFKVPRHLDLQPAAGSGNKPLYAIYSLETENCLRLCFSQKSRPSQFKTSANSDAILFEVKRESIGRASINETADRLASQCKNNRTLAASTFPRDQILEVKGKVLSSRDGHVLLDGGPNGDHIDCALSPNYQSGLVRASKLNKDDEVKVRGTYKTTVDNGRGRGSVIVQLERCELVE